jgi:5'-deoxynucleotidase YfbR-like HD superfamily hydrolase
MLSGRRLDLADPSPLDIEIADIAHGLARVARWNGQTHGRHAFSVAQHSCLVLSIFDQVTGDRHPASRQATLLHDAPEYVVGDLISPFKAIIGDGYRGIEQRLLAAIHRRFGLAAPADDRLRRAIKRADAIAAYHEAVHLAGFSAAEAKRLFGAPGTVDLDERLLSPWPASRAQRQFLSAWRQCGGEAQRT